ncbi:MAG: saccharopine dehydrogenase C-terminal domain-containing protein [Bacteroidota bacterium]
MQKTILVLGAGKSAIYLLEYLRDHAKTENWNLTIADVHTAHLQKDFPTAQLVDLNLVEQLDLLHTHIDNASIVISMVPAFMHPIVAKACLAYSKNLLTPSYVSDELKAMEADVIAKGLIFLNELGVDPGIDHMSAMQIIHHLKEKGARITSFESYCGGLIAPESDTNPWHYKFTWNPRNVILAGQGTAKFLVDGQYKYIPYHTLFERTDIFHIDGYGDFEGYANRDSLKYIESYDLHEIKTMYRGTFRRPPYCSAWQVFVRLGMCDDSYVYERNNKLTAASFVSSFITGAATISIAERFIQYLAAENKSTLLPMFEYLDLFNNELEIPLHCQTPAQILQFILEPKLALAETDKDMLVMLHQFEYELDGVSKSLTSSLVVLGEDKIHTAMAKTVGLPIAIACKLILNGTIQDKGVLIPVQPSIYEPIMQELKSFGISFVEKEA